MLYIFKYRRKTIAEWSHLMGSIKICVSVSMVEKYFDIKGKVIKIE